MIINNIHDMLQRDEGIRLFPYTDSVGKLTIGVGRNLTDRGISPDEAEVLLGHDIEEAEDTAIAHFPWYGGLSEARQAVILNMIFNMGIDRLLGFKKMLAACSQWDWQTAGLELLDSQYAKQVGVRASRLARQLTEGVWIQ